MRSQGSRVHGPVSILFIFTLVNPTCPFVQHSAYFKSFVELLPAAAAAAGAGRGRAGARGGVLKIAYAIVIGVGDH